MEQLCLSQPCFLYFSFYEQTYSPFPLQVRKPVQIISDDVMVVASRTRYYDDTLVIRYLGYFLHGASGAHLKRQNIKVRD